MSRAVYCMWHGQKLNETQCFGLLLSRIGKVRQCPSGRMNLAQTLFSRSLCDDLRMDGVTEMVRRLIPQAL